MSSRGYLVFAAFVLALLGGAFLVNRAIDAEEEAAATLRAERRDARQREAEERVGRLVAESSELMPPPLRGIALGMLVDEVRQTRDGQLRPLEGRSGSLALFEERLVNGGQVVYGFDAQSLRLVQIQVLSMMPTLDAIAPHLAAMNEAYGPPTGVWDCPTTGNVPTRRFTWRRSLTTISDVFLVYGERASVTLYIATSEQIGQSLQMASCVPVPRERLDQFPVATAEQMQQAAGPGR